MYIMRSRRSKLLTLFFFTCLLLLGFAWRNAYQVSSLGIPLYSYPPSSTILLPFANTFTNELKLDKTVLGNPNETCKAVEFQVDRKIEPSLHLLIPASEANDMLCRTVLSSFLLNYPSATLINFGKTFNGDNWDKGSHAGKIQGVFDYFSKEERARDDDLVLIIDGYDVWFQLPPEILVKRYHTSIQQANERLKRIYGLTSRQKAWEGFTKHPVQKYTQTVIFGTDKLCWPNAADSPACASLPPSTLPPDAYGPTTDKDPEGFHNRPRYLNSGIIMGPISDVRAIYERAIEKVTEGRGAIGDQYVFAEILGEQEYQREASLQSSQNFLSRWLEWQFNSRGIFSHSTLKPSPPNTTVLPNQRYEFSIGLDYTSSLFQTMTHSQSDISFISDHNATYPLPTDLLTARPPFPGPYDPTSLATSSIPPFSPALDTLPNASSSADIILPSWLTIPLATNIITSTTPTLLHINGDKSLLVSWWPRIWYYSHARALLRAYMRSPQPFLWGTVNQTQRTWDRRGGRGGVWTQENIWLGWGEVCKGVEESVFGDGKGAWGLEEGDGRTWNFWGTQLTGDIIDKKED